MERGERHPERGGRRRGVSPPPPGGWVRLPVTPEALLEAMTLGWPEPSPPAEGEEGPPKPSCDIWLLTTSCPAWV